MADDYRQQIGELMDQAYEAEGTRQQLMLIDQAVRLADAHQDERLSFDLRGYLIEVGTFRGAPEMALAAFTWCLGMCDRRPDEFDETELLWSYKWIANELWDFPQLSREQIESSFQDMTRRYQRAGYGLGPIYKLRMRKSLECGDDGHAEYFEKWRNAPHDVAASDCVACEQNDLVCYLGDTGDYEQALRAAQPIIDGRMHCAEIPHLTYALLPHVYFHLGQHGEAEKVQRRGYKLIHDNPEFLREVARHLEYLSLAGQFDRGVTLFEKHLGWAMEAFRLGASFQFHLAAAMLLRGLRRQGRPELKLRLPRDFAGYREDGRYPLPVLSEEVERTVNELAKRFDQRNGNDHFAQTRDRAYATVD